MEFRDTGLPMEPTVYKAYTTYLQNLPNLPEGARARDLPLLTAQLLNEKASHKPALLATALLYPMPPVTHSQLDKRFGPGFTAGLREMQDHILTRHAYLDQASDNARLIAAAMLSLSLSRLRETAEKMLSRVTEPQEADMTGAPLALPVLPEPETLERVARRIEGKTSSPVLEQHYRSAVEDFKIFREDYVRQLAAAGIPLDAFAQGAYRPGFAPFESTGLLQDDRVRAVYDLLGDDPRPLPADLAAALEVGSMLSRLPQPEAVTVAAGMLNAALRNFTPADRRFLAKTVDAGVIALAADYSVYRAETMSPARLLQAPRAARQIALAFSTSALGGMRDAGQEILALAAPGLGIPEMERQMILRQNLLPLRMAMTGLLDCMTPVLDACEAPSLAAAFNQRAGQLKAVLAEGLAPAASPPPGRSTPPKPPAGP